MTRYKERVETEMQLARLGALLRMVPAEAIRLHANEVGGQPADRSDYQRDLDASERNRPLVGTASGLALLWLLDASHDYFDALDGVLAATTARRHAPRPLVRTIVEHAARASWLMEPGLTPGERGARAWLAEAVSADQLKQAFRGSRSNQAKRDGAEREKWVRQRIAEMFGDGALNTPRGWQNWTLAQQRYDSITGVVGGFAHRHFPAQQWTGFLWVSLNVDPSDRCLSHGLFYTCCR